MLTIDFGNGSVWGAVMRPHCAASAISFSAIAIVKVKQVWRWSSQPYSKHPSRLLFMHVDSIYVWECFGASIPSVGACIHAEFDNRRLTRAGARDKQDPATHDIHCTTSPLNAFIIIQQIHIIIEDE